MRKQAGVADMIMKKDKLAIDNSARRIDADGRLHLEMSHISKAAINPYYGKEIPGWEALGLTPDKVYQLLRDPAELEKAAPTFARIPVLSKHMPVTADDTHPELIIGAVGSDVDFKKPYLNADLCIWDALAIAGIESDQVKELSCAYRYVPVMEPGEFEGKPYDGRMTEIQGNHLAVVEVGRAGPDVVVADNNPFKNEVSMKMSKLGKALFAALCAASPKLAADSALPALVGMANRKTFNKEDVKTKLLALDVELDPQQLDNVIDALLDVEQEPKPLEPPKKEEEPGAVDESPEEKVKQLLAGKVDEETINSICALIAPKANDEDPDKKDDSMSKEEVKEAMDSLRKELREAEEARRDVRPVIGDIYGQDSAADVYKFALDHMKIDHTDVEGAAALKALFKVAAAGIKTEKPVNVAQDSADLTAKFPGAARFRTI